MKKIVVLATVFLLAAGCNNFTNNTRSMGATNDTRSTSNTNTSPTSSLDLAWRNLQQYISFAKAHDFKGMENVESEYSSTHGQPCPGTTEECNQLLDSMSSEMAKLNKADFINVWEDSKQLILSTNPIQITSQRQGELHYEKTYLYFTKTDGQVKFLKSSIIDKLDNYSQSTETPEKQLQKTLAKFDDKDQDGLLDSIENCGYSDVSPYNASCSGTNASKRDSLGDGWWDGIRANIKQ